VNGKQKYQKAVQIKIILVQVWLRQYRVGEQIDFQDKTGELFE
jgi:hypothetical protein